MRKSLTVALVIGACSMAVPVSRTALAAYQQGESSCLSWSGFAPPSYAPPSYPGSYQQPPSSEPSPAASVPASAGSVPASAGSVPASAGSVPGWVPAGSSLIFDDEFSKHSSLNSEWTPGWFGTGDTGPVNTLEEAGYSSSNVSISGGTLNLALDRSPVTVRGRTFPYTGAIVTTMGHFTFTYGDVEWMAYLPESPNGQVADWPALWADGTGPWPSTGEMDVMEGLGGIAAAHFESPAGNPGIRAGTAYWGWHTFGVAWTQGSATYYYDGKAIGTISQGITGAPMYLIMDNTISANSLAASSYPAVMRIAWVRVWSGK